MPRRSNCSARRSPMPLRNLTGVSSRRTPAEAWARCGMQAGGTGVMRPRREARVPSGADPWALGEQVGREALGVERLEIVHPFAYAEKADGQIELATERRHRAAARAPVELGNDQAGG